MYFTGPFLLFYCNIILFYFPILLIPDTRNHYSLNDTRLFKLIQMIQKSDILKGFFFLV